MATCDVTKWDSATACHGVDAPWAASAYVDYVAVNGATPAVLGSFKAWHFLAEKNADTGKNFQIVKDDKVNWIVQEKYELIAGTGATTTNDSKVGHSYGTFTSTGATSTIMGATAIIAGVVASMF